MVWCAWISEYSRDKSLLSDLRLLLKTPAALLSAKGHIDKRRYRMIRIGVIGYGYWGPNIVRISIPLREPEW